jgi:hypothetical protein
MISRRLVAGMAILVCLIVLWNFLHPTYSYRYRLTVEVEKNGKLHSGSSVIELTTTRNYFLSALDTVPEWETAYRGEAVFVDLGGSDHLIALLESPNGKRPTARFPSNVILGEETAKTGIFVGLDVLPTKYPDRLAEAKGKPYPVNLEQMPPLIRFRQLDDPLTVERVDPANLAASYGLGVVLRGAHLEITEDAVSNGIAKRLPWLGRMRPDKALSGDGGSSWRAGELPYSTPRQIAYWNFLAE